MSTKKICRIVNNTAARIGLMSTDSYPLTLYLRPGDNDVELAYLEELEALEVSNYDKENKPTGKTRFPGKLLLDELQVPVWYDKPSPNGMGFSRLRGPRITIYRDLDQAPTDSAGVIPVSLDGYKKEAALALIKVISDKDALRRYTKSRDKEVASAATAKLNGEVVG